ncbi:bifunctional [glutamine synthetase] adenylyltransferase/[glutamine synthetase]-adenylyl-L-tyrosine phosphorylase [Streptomyces radicis]|uniref:Bifunctional glutamine synthetase adenylyltransferase/adenylyl-removing enzyme n=1 Tax=Streptomyces radicis TaxID=1750517 RepID=A0A3A9WHB3_9ACTN|nr:bifunctional [glutamine synthetase] adenylyltransferase/[glutamine synthetase]-adenylyl-L-tyrosine phosphorylase [Streptomyces radicis]RKN12169.1 bifunctional [glutamine synthetase] adenylyltransferase/[glutamine synthetase]-adenylyl-L-tyrosine phosphorylase [Streptomyces radicis]RKN25778.1 bifunctional [glutamine synthetase] adenylyltransferase/[glutamine synthetase]-adenylyl-L-tyrosine phosphorylase [Streptomyces radicis]
MPLGGRRDSRFGQLLRRGFTDPTDAARLLDAPALRSAAADGPLLDALAATADPDAALGALVRLAEAQPDGERAAFLDTLLAAKPLRDRLLAVLGASDGLADHLVRHPAEWRALVAFETADLHPGTEEFEAALADAADPDGLRVAYHRALLTIAARDITGTTDVAETAAELADLATATLRAALRIAAAAAPDDDAACRLAVIGMGKCGGRELNYVSDVDVIFVAEPADGADEGPALQAATRLAAHLMRICSDTTAEGTIWPVDANLRPEGRNGPLVRTLVSHLAYYRRWAKTWEFQALLKARPVAGDEALGAEYAAAVAPLVWQAVERENFVSDVQRMRRRVESSIPAAQAERELKLGPGGLRDVEFAVQLLQLVHGRTDPELRGSSTLDALAALAAGGYVGRQDAASLDASYRFLRTVEHRIQLRRLRRTHLMPTEEAELRSLGRSLGFAGEPVKELTAAWRRHTAGVRRLHEKLFYRPLLDAVARLDAGQLRLGQDAAKERLVALGFADPAAALRHLSALASGVTRKAAIQRTLLPVLMASFADSADPDSGLLNFRKVSDALGTSPWYLRLLRDEGAAAENLARVLSAGRLAPDLLLRAPEAVALLGAAEGLAPRPPAALAQEIQAAVGRADTAESAVAVARGVRRRELFRTAAADIVGAYAPDVAPHEAPGQALDRVGSALTALNAATLRGALTAATAAIGHRPPPARLAVIAMGRFGGHELSYGSDADVVLVHEPAEGADERAAAEAASAIANEMIRLLQLPSIDPPLLVDTHLRPEGRNGPLVRSLTSYAAYYRRWSLVWESQALLRAEPVAGDADLGRRFTELIDPLRYPVGGLDQDAIREIRRLKARMEAERLPRGADPTLHTKLGRGGLSDVEWTVQLLQLRHAHEVEALRTTRTRGALAAAVGAGLLDAEDAEVLDEAWVLASRVRNAVMLVRARPQDTFPADARESAAVARYLGYEPGTVGRMLDDYRRTTRRARTVVERLFYEG